MGIINSKSGILGGGEERRRGEGERGMGSGKDTGDFCLFL